MSNPSRRAVGAAMILAPILGLASAIASPALRGSAAGTVAEIAHHPDRWYLYALFVTISSWLFAPAVIGLAALTQERMPRTSLAGAALALLGVLVAVGDATTELLYWQMGAPGADRGQMVALAERYDGATGASLLFAVGGLALVAGLVLLAVALLRSGAAPAWAAAAIPAGTVVNIAGFGLSSNLAVAASNLVLFAAFGWIGRRLLAADAPHVASVSPRPAGATS